MSTQSTQTTPETPSQYVDQGSLLPVEEPSPRAFLERLSRWRKAGRCRPLRVGKRRLLLRDEYLRLLREDSAVSPPSREIDDTDEQLRRVLQKVGR